MPKVYNARTDDIPAGAVWVDRRSPYGNPFKMQLPEDRDAVCDWFEEYTLRHLDVTELRGKDLVCWCAPLRCHADAILRKANEVDRVLIDDPRPHDPDAPMRDPFGRIKDV